MFQQLRYGLSACIVLNNGIEMTDWSVKWSKPSRDASSIKDFLGKKKSLIISSAKLWNNKLFKPESKNKTVHYKQSLEQSLITDSQYLNNLHGKIAY